MSSPGGPQSSHHLCTIDFLDSDIHLEEILTQGIVLLRL